MNYTQVHLKTAFNRLFLRTKQIFNYFLILILNTVKIKELFEFSKHSCSSNQMFIPNCFVANNYNNKSVANIHNILT